MPTYMGVLNEKPAIPTMEELVQGYTGTVYMPHDAFDEKPPSARELAKTAQQDAESGNMPTTTAISSKRASWRPSGGKKLQTGLAVVLENVTAGFTRPNVLDVKLGKRLWADDAPQSKRAKLDSQSKETTSGSLGFRIAGMRVWIDGTETVTAADKAVPELNVEVRDGYKCYDKSYGRAFTADNVKDAFVTFLGGNTEKEDGKPRLSRKNAQTINNRFIRELESLQFVLENTESRMYSASVLMVYEGDEAALEVALEEERRKDEEEKRKQQEHAQNGTASDTADEKDNDDEDEDEDAEMEDDDDDWVEPKVHEMRLIDFAHAQFTPGLGQDENALQGVRSVLKVLKELLE